MWDEQIDFDGLDLSRSPLFGRRWTRIVLDEAHRIKNAKGSTAQAAFNLRGKRRWCVSGTPIQNRIGEVHSLVRFLRFYPYAFNRCSRKGCTCECLFVSSTCKGCGHRKAQHRSIFATEISTPIRQFGFVGKGKTALESLRLDIFQELMLRRTKDTTLNLPSLSIKIKKIALSERESRAYIRIRDNDRQIVQDLAARGALMQNFAHVFSLIMRERQAANHPQLAKFGLSSRCPCCQGEVDEMKEDVEVLACGRHACHESCYVDLFLREAPEGAEVHCPYCEDEQVQPLQGATIVQGLQEAGRCIHISSKIKALIEEIKEQLLEPSEPPAQPHKFLVFSSFAHFLELCSHFLEQEGIGNAAIVGKTRLKIRERIIQRFRTETDFRVLLISLQVGGEGLNLQVADRVYLMDPWWNPAMEQQAYQRAHRSLDRDHYNMFFGLQFSGSFIFGNPWRPMKSFYEFLVSILSKCLGVSMHQSIISTLGVQRVSGFPKRFLD